MSRDIRGLVEIAAAGPCEIYGGLSDLYVRHYRGPNAPRASVEMLRAAAQLHWRAGVSAIHLFNYDCHATDIQHHNTEEEVGLEEVPLFSPPEFQALTEIGDSGLIEFRDKQYLVTHDMEHRTPDEGGEGAASGGAGSGRRCGRDRAENRRRRQRRTAARKGGGGDDAHRADRVPRRGGPAAGGVERRPPGDAGRRFAGRLRRSAGKEGANRLRILLEERYPGADGALRVEGVEVLVSYRGAD